MTRVPKGAVVPVASMAWLIREALEQKTQLAWCRLLSFCYWGLQCPVVDPEDEGPEADVEVLEPTVLGHADVDMVLIQFREVIPDIRLVELDRLELLGAPVVGRLSRRSWSRASCFAVAGGI